MGANIAASMPVGTESTRAASRPLSRISCSRSARPVVTTRAVALRYSQRVARSFGTGIDTCRVRTSTGAARRVRSSHTHASASSQASVELCALTMSTGFRASVATRLRTPRSRLRPIGSATIGTPNRGASATIRAPAAA